MKSYGFTIQMKPRQQYFHMVLFAFQHITKKETGKFSRIGTLATSGIKKNTKRAPLLSAHFFSHQMSPFTRILTVEWCVESYFAFALVTVKPENKEGQ